LAGERRDDERRRRAALDEAGHAEAGEECRQPVGDAAAQHTTQVASVDPQDAGAHDVRAPHEERNAGKEVQQRLHRLTFNRPAHHQGSEYVFTLVKLFIASSTPSL
jgi:hypothetical protein